ncbi:MAG: hypothetical protein NC922_08405 [Candidatus Omnitrophica bacterium]|nr:hypothetical protein [Candidatus Omnitrophota bacterium]
MIYNWELIFSYGYLPEYKNEFVVLLKYVLTKAKYMHKNSVRALFPCDEELADILLKNNIEFEIVEHYDSIAGNMIKIVDIGKTLEALTPEIRRLSSNIGKLIIDFSDIERTFILNLNENIDKEVKLNISIKEFIQWLKGSNINLKTIKDKISFYLGYPKYTEF